MKTMICLILDRSGSMNGREADVIGGVNAFLDDQKKLPDPASIAFVRFDTGNVERFREMKPLADVEPLQASEYQPRGGTPLLDAIGQTIVALEDDWKREKPDRAIVVIVTDGEENASHEFTKDKIKALIEARQNSKLWAFVYLGANVDAFHEAGAMGFSASNTAGYTNTTRGTAKMYATASAGVSHMRMSGHTEAHNLGRNIGEDDDDDINRALAPTPAAPPTPPIAPGSTWTPPSGAPMSAGTWTPP
jgi:uncharacterized protein YegL